MKIKLTINNKEVNGFIIDEVDGFYTIGTYLGIVHRRKEEINKLNNLK